MTHPEPLPTKRGHHTPEDNAQIAEHCARIAQERPNALAWLEMMRRVSTVIILTLSGCGDTRPAPWMDNFAKLTTMRPTKNAP